MIGLRMWESLDSEAETLICPEGFTEEMVRCVAQTRIDLGKSAAVHVLVDDRPVAVYLTEAAKRHIHEVTGMTPEQIQAFAS